MPSQINTARILFLISAILNLLYALGLGGYAAIMGLFTCGVGCLLFAVPVISIIACTMDFIAYNKLNLLNRTGTYNSVQFAAIMDIVSVLTGNPVSLIFGIINLIYLNDEKVKAFLVERRIY